MMFPGILSDTIGIIIIVVSLIIKFIGKDFITQNNTDKIHIIIHIVLHIIRINQIMIS